VQVVLVCFDGMDLGAELEVVADISAAVVNARQRPVFVYAAEPSQVMPACLLCVCFQSGDTSAFALCLF
jgi:hypothetical protein